MKFKLPIILSAAVMREFAPKEESHAIRIVLLNSTGPTQFTLRGNGKRKGKYLLQKEAKSGRHILDVPCSIWNDGIPAEKYHDNLSIAHDLCRPSPLTPFVTMIVPWYGATAQPAIPKATPAEQPDMGKFLDILETMVLRLAETTNIKRCDSLLTPYLHQAIQRQAAEPATALFQKFNRAEILEFSEKMWPSELSPPSACHEPSTPQTENIPENSQPEPAKTETAAAKRMREKRARDKAAKLQTA